MSTFLLTVEVVGIFALLIASGFFSGSETAYFSLRKWRVERLKASGKRGIFVSELLSNPRGLIAAILIGNETVNIAASNLAAIIRRDYFSIYGTAGIMTALIMMTLLIFFIGEVTPKVIAIYNSERWALKTSVPLRHIFKAIFPVRRFVELIAYRFDRFFMKKDQKRSEDINMNELRSLVQESAGDAGPSHEEAGFIDAIFGIATMPVKTMMIPRPRIVAMKEDVNLDEALTIARKWRFSRFPVYGDDIDDIKGVVHAKELLSAHYGAGAIHSIKEVMRPVLLMPETKIAFEALRSFQVNHIHLAVLLDEYGGTAGMITIDDILTEIVGETEDKTKPFASRFKKVSDNVLMIDGSTSLQEFKELSGAGIEDPDVETIAGFLLKIMGKIPSEGEEVRFQHFIFRVLKMSGRRIVLIEVRIPEQSDRPSDG